MLMASKLIKSGESLTDGVKLFYPATVLMLYFYYIFALVSCQCCWKKLVLTSRQEHYQACATHCYKKGHCAKRHGQKIKLWTEDNL